MIDLSDVSAEWAPEERMKVVSRITHAAATNNYFFRVMPTDVVRMLNVILDAPPETLQRIRNDIMLSVSKYKPVHTPTFSGFGT